MPPANTCNTNRSVKLVSYINGYKFSITLDGCISALIKEKIEDDYQSTFYVIINQTMSA